MTQIPNSVNSEEENNWNLIELWKNSSTASKRVSTLFSFFVFVFFFRGNTNSLPVPQQQKHPLANYCSFIVQHDVM